MSASRTGAKRHIYRAFPTDPQAARVSLGRVHQVNRDPYWLFRVTKAVLFGSMLTDSPTVGDVDLSIELAPKVDDRDELWRLRVELSDEAVQDGRRFSNYTAYLHWPEREVVMFLGARTRTLHISLTENQAAFMASVPQRVLFEEA